MTPSLDPSTHQVQFPIRFFDHRPRTTDTDNTVAWDEEEDWLPYDQAPPTRLPSSARRYGSSPYGKTRPQTQALVPPRRTSAQERVPVRQPRVTRRRLWFTLIVSMLAM